MSGDRLTVLVAHSRYQVEGGEEGVVTAERALLERAGHDVVVHERDNDELEALGPAGRIRAGLESGWSRRARRDLAELIRRHQPDVAHFHNLQPLLSPSVYAACRDAGVPVVQTLHNYRLVCPKSLLFRDGHECTECVGRAVPLPAVRHRCLRGSTAQSALVTITHAAHRAARTWHRQVDVYVALSQFARRLLVDAGAVPADRVVVKPNFVDPEPRPRPPGDLGSGVVLVGRLSPEKGVDDLLDAAALAPQVPVELVGDGPLLDHVRDRIARPELAHVTTRGRLPKTEVHDAMRRARAVVVPSRFYEGMPLTVLEAYACGVPVIAHDIGSLTELVDDDTSGRLVPVGDRVALAAALEEVGEDDTARRWSTGARRRYDERHRHDVALSDLLAVYDRARRRST